MAFVRSAAFYLAGFASAVALAFFLLGAGRPRPGAGEENLAENAAMAAWMLGVTSLPAAAGFAAVACASRGWRSLSAPAAGAIAAVCGALGYLAYLTGLGIAAGFYAIPGVGPVAILLKLVLPGALLGALALAAARALRQPPERAA